MSTSFIGNENKGLIWQLLTEADAFANIPNTYFTRVKQLYENIIAEVAELKETNLTEKNKMVITEMMRQLSYFKKFESQKPVNQLRPLEEVKIEINKDYENKKNEFIKLVNHETPSEISFNDKNDDPLDSTVMNNLLNSMMQNRERDLNQIHPEKQSDELEEQITPINDPLTKINKVDSDRKVSFSTENFISKLKKIGDHKEIGDPKEIDDPKQPTDVKAILNTIITNQRSNIAVQQDMLNHLILLQNILLHNT